MYQVNIKQNDQLNDSDLVSKEFLLLGKKTIVALKMI